MAGQRNTKLGVRLWMKILGVAVLSIIVTNIGIVLFYFDQVPTGRWLGAGTQGASIARKLRTPKDQPLTVDDTSSDHPQPSRDHPEGHHTEGDNVGAPRDSMADSLETPQNHVATSRSPQTRAKTSRNHNIHVDSLGGHPVNDVTLGPGHVNGDHSGVSKKNVSDGKASRNTAGLIPAMNAESAGSSKNDRTKANSSSPLIVWWDPVEGLGEEDVHCGHHTCHVSVDRHRWGEQDTMVMSFYGTSLSCHDLPVPRGEGDLWALFHDESPKNLDFLFSHRAVMQLFNYTSTFRRHSHLPFPTQWLDDVRELTSTQYVVPVATKSALRRGTERLSPVVYVQSDCSVPSDRDHFVRLLQQHVPVDCYGTCLHNRQFPNSTSLTFQRDMSAMTAEDFYRVLAQYKFAIAIENAVCPGYITEKLWRPLQLGVVPIVFGAPDIKEFLPSENCALVVDDFQSAEELAQAILYYDSHDTQYSQLLHYKQTGITNPALQSHLHKRHGTSQYRAQITEDYHCMLCEKLHEAISARKSGRPIPPSVASQDHYGCPKPGKFNDKGQYMAEVTGHWQEPWTRSQATACLMKALIDNGTRLSLDTFEARVRHTERNFEHMCLQYF